MTTESIKIAAIEALISSITCTGTNHTTNDATANANTTANTTDKNGVSGTSHMRLAQRILSSSIGELSQQQQHQQSDRHTPPYLLKKIERSYKKRIKEASSSSRAATVRDTDDHKVDQSHSQNQTKHVQNTMQQARALTTELMNDGIENQLLSDLLLLFSRLAASPSTSPFTQQTSSPGIHQISNQPSMITAAIAAATSNARPATIISYRHEQLAIQNDESDILRECIHALQFIDGELLQFYKRLSSSSSQSDKRNVYNPSTSTSMKMKTEMDSHMGQYDGIRIKPGLLSFELNSIQRFNHRSSNSASGGKDAIRICCEAGWLYNRIQTFRTEVQLHGVVPRALSCALSKEMDAYHSFLHQLQLQLQLDHSNSKRKAESRKEGEHGYGHGHEYGHAKKLTLRKLLLLLRGPMGHLRTLGMVVDGMKRDVNGGQLLLCLYLHSMHGDQRHREIVERILYESSKPWYDLLYDWTLAGMLSDGGKKGGEFFIVEDTNVADANLWHGRYLLQEGQVPHVPGVGDRGGLLSERLAKDILIVGKGVNFIRRCLHDSEWEFDLRDLLPRSLWGDGSAMMVDTDKNGDGEVLRQIKLKLGFHYDANSDEAFDISGKSGEIITHTKLEKTVAVAASQVHRHILSSLFEHHHLLDHLRGLKEILFLGQGDFICALMDALHTEFESRDGIHEIYMISMMNIVHDALRTTNAKFLPEYVTKRVQIRLLSGESSADTFWTDGANKDGEKEGWDIFTLDYAIDAPLTAIVHPKAMEKYHLVFNLLFRLKKIEWMMNNTWRQSTTLTHALQFMITKFGTVALAPGSSLKSENTLSRMKRLLRKFAMTRQCMLHFLTNLQSYLMFEVLESGWKDLVQKLQGATTLDEVITSHDEYLNDILEKSLVGEALLEDAGVEGSGSELPKQLRLVLSAAFRFCKMHDNIFSEGVETIQKATEKRRGAQKRSAHGEWGFDQFDADVEGLNFYSLADEASLVEVESISEEFDMSLRTLLSMLNDRINGNSVRDVDVSSPSLMRPTQTQSSDQANASKNDALRFLTFRLDFSAFYGL